MLSSCTGVTTAEHHGTPQAVLQSPFSARTPGLSAQVPAAKIGGRYMHHAVSGMPASACNPSPPLHQSFLGRGGLLQKLVLRPAEWTQSFAHIALPAELKSFLYPPV